MFATQCIQNNYLFDVIISLGPTNYKHFYCHDKLSIRACNTILFKISSMAKHLHKLIFKNYLPYEFRYFFAITHVYFLLLGFCINFSAISYRLTVL